MEIFETKTSWTASANKQRLFLNLHVDDKSWALELGKQ